MQFIALFLAAQLATAARANSGTSLVCVHWFGNNLDWTKISEATQYGNTPWGIMKPGMHCTKRCYLREGRYQSFKRCPQGCVDGKCTGFVVKTAVSTTAAPVAIGSETVDYGIRFSLVAVMMLSVGAVAVMIQMIFLVIRLCRSRKDLGQDPEECREDHGAASSV